MPRSSWVALVVLVSFGCVLDEVALEGRPCPGAPGWTCDERNLCETDARPLSLELGPTSVALRVRLR